VQSQRRRQQRGSHSEPESFCRHPEPEPAWRSLQCCERHDTAQLRRRSIEIGRCWQCLCAVCFSKSAGEKASAQSRAASCLARTAARLACPLVTAGSSRACWPVNSQTSQDSGYFRDERKSMQVTSHALTTRLNRDVMLRAAERVPQRAQRRHTSDKRHAHNVRSAHWERASRERGCARLCWPGCAASR
jgi:hypothetical protein